MIDFREIPVSNSGCGNQDTFELFARDFFELLGYEIIDSPGRGADGGCDLILKETQKGISNIKTEIHWLVSCKHYAKSGKSITPLIESNINDRILANNCNGFIGFYSTIPSEGLITLIKKIPTQIFDNKKIEQYIIGNESFNNIFSRYFPKSYKKWQLLKLPYNPIKLFEFYLNEKHKYEKQLLLSIFLKIETLFVALLNSYDFQDFLNFREIKLYLVENLDEELNIIYQNDKSFYTKDLNNFTWTIFQDFVNINLQNRNLSDEKLVSYTFSNQSKYILSTNSIFLNKNKIGELEELYADLKKMINF